MKLRKWKWMTALCLSATMAITLHLPAQDNLNPKLNLTFAGGDGRGQVIVYSDSMADNGNIYKILGFPGPPYWKGRLSNGPVAVENMAAILGMPPTDYAYAATTGLGNLFDGGTVDHIGSLGLPGITTSCNTTINSFPRSAIGRSLFVVYGGTNDFFLNGLTTDTANHAVANLVAGVADLQTRGARWILVPGLYDSKYVNQRLLASLPKGVRYFDTFGLYQAMRTHPGAFGLTDVVAQCLDPNTGAPCPNPDQYPFLGFRSPNRTRTDHFGDRICIRRAWLRSIRARAICRTMIQSTARQRFRHSLKGEELCSRYLGPGTALHAKPMRTSYMRNLNRFFKSNPKGDSDE